MTRESLVRFFCTKLYKGGYLRAFLGALCSKMHDSKFQECQELNLGLLGKRGKCYLCAMPPADMSIRLDVMRWKGLYKVNCEKVVVVLTSGYSHVNSSCLYYAGQGHYRAHCEKVVVLPSGKASEVMRNWTQAAPVPWPIRVTFLGSPPNLSMFSWTQCRAAIWKTGLKFCRGSLKLEDYQNKPQLRDNLIFCSSTYFRPLPITA